MALLTLLEVDSLAGLRGPQLDLLIVAPNGLSCSSRLACASSFGSPRVPKSSKRGLAPLKSFFVCITFSYVSLTKLNPDSKEWKVKLTDEWKETESYIAKQTRERVMRKFCGTFYSQPHLLELKTMRYRDHPKWPRQKPIVDINKVSPFSTAIDRPTASAPGGRTGHLGADKSQPSCPSLCPLSPWPIILKGWCVLTTFYLVLCLYSHSILSAIHTVSWINLLKRSSSQKKWCVPHFTY